MNIEALTLLASKLYGFIKPVITSELGKEIAGDFKEATKGSMRELWLKVKPWFIVEDEEVEELKDIKENPDNPILEDAFLAKLRAKLSKHEGVRKDLDAMLAELEKSDDPAAQYVIQHSKNFNTGTISGVKGNVRFGDNINTPLQD